MALASSFLRKKNLVDSVGSEICSGTGSHN